MAISQVIDTPPTAPNRATMTDAVYSAAADAMMAYLKTLASEQNLWATQANALAAAMNAVAAGAAYSIAYTFDTTTTDSDPGNGKLRLDNATQGSAATVRMDLLDQAGSDWTAALDQFDGSTSTVKGYLTLRKLSDGTKWILFSVSARAAPSGYRNISVAVVAISGSNPFANGDTIVAEFSRTGDKGNTGPAAWAATTAWTTTTVYTATAPISVVTQGGSTYGCLVAHTSGVFATDLAAGKWQLLAAKGTDGSSSYALTFYGDKSDGNVTVSGAVTLSRDMYYNTLTIAAGAALNTNGWRIFADTLDLSAAPAGSIFNNGGAGGNATTSTITGAAGSAAPGNTVGASAAGVVGKNSAGTGAGLQGNAGLAGNNGGAGAAGGAGGSQSGGAGGAASGAGTASATVLHRAVAALTINDFSTTLLTGGASGGGGSGGAGDGSGAGGCYGGGSGAGGGVVFIAARIINRGASTAAAAIQARGGNGGNGGQSVGIGPGGGGAGGGGGWVYILCDSLTGATATSAVDVTGGGGGSGGGLGIAAADGGGTGAGGRFTLGVQSTSTYTDTLSGVAASAGNAHSGTTGGAAKTATAAQFSL